MELIDTENLISTPNKINEDEIIIEKYFKPFLQRNLKVSYILVSEEDKANNFINKIINTVLTSIDIEQYPPISNKNNFVVPLPTSELKVKISCELAENKDTLWEVVFEGNFIVLEDFRTRFLSSILDDKKNVFKKKYCVQDEVSDLICNIAYPMVRELENNLRDYLLRFFTKKFGNKWWDIGKSPQLEGKVKDRERTFNGLLDMQLYSIDFIDLIELLDGKARVENSEIIEAFNFLSVNRENEEKFDRKIENLKSKLKGNWEKFFEEKITVSNFIKMWEDLYSIRCDIAHNCFLNLKKFTRLINCYNEVKGQLSKLIDELRIVKTIEYEILEKILSINIFFSKEDIESLIEYGSFHLAPQNFSKESLSVSEFDTLLNEIKDEFLVFGEYELSEYQFNLDNEEKLPAIDVQIESITRTIFFNSIPADIKHILQLGINDNKF